MGQLDMKSGADVVALDAERQRRVGDSDSALSTAGGMLSAAREALGWTTEELALRTNIKEQHIISIEAMDAESLPSQPYTMGFVRAFAREVELPEDALMARFREQIGYDSQANHSGFVQKPRGKDLNDGKELSAILLLAIVGLFVFVAWKILTSAAPETSDEATRFQFSKDDQEAALVAPGVADGALPENREPTVEAFSDTSAPEPGLPSDAAEEMSDDADEVPAEVSLDPAEESAADPTESLLNGPAEDPVAVLRRLTAVDPVYPPLCEGSAEAVETVTVAFTISDRGRPVSRRITQSSNPCFNGAALAALERWRYDPSTVTDGTRAQTARFTFDRPY